MVDSILLHHQNCTWEKIQEAVITLLAINSGMYSGTVLDKKWASTEKKKKDMLAGCVFAYWKSQKILNKLT